MFDQLRIKTGFMGLVGLRQNDNPSFPQLASSLLYDGSNVLIDHPLINMENIDACAKNYGQYLYPTYNALTTYGQDTPQTMVRVKYLTKSYRSKVASNTGNQPDTSPTQWEEVNLLSAYLEDLFQSANLDTVVETFNKKKLNGQTKTLLQNLRLFDGAGNMNDFIVPDGSFVGLEIMLRHNQNIHAVIEKIGLQLTQAQDLTMYLFHSSQVEAIATVVLNHTKLISFQWHTAGLKINYNDPAHEPGGLFYLMYDQDALVGQAIRKPHNFHLRPCSGCNLGNAVATWDLYSKYVAIRTVKVNAADRNGTDLWDITKTLYAPDNNFGLNLELTMKCDLTEFLLQQKTVFAYAVRDMVSFKLLSAMANSTRQNNTGTKIDVLARNELAAKYTGGMGFMENLEKQLKAVNIEIATLDETCMPCAKTSGLQYGTIGLNR